MQTYQQQQKKKKKKKKKKNRKKKKRRTNQFLYFQSFLKISKGSFVIKKVHLLLRMIFFTRCVKSVRIPSFSSPYFPAFGLNAGKYGPEKIIIRTIFTQ